MLALALFLATSSMNASADARDIGMRLPVAGPTSTVTLDAMPYTRTVTCGSYTLTGTFTGSTPTWSASPSGASGSCSDDGGGAFSCVVAVSPDATGEGVETVTVTNGASDAVDIGFYVSGAHSCFLSQSVDGSYNATLADLDAVATWENVGSSALDVTQGTGAAQPTFRTGIVGGQPVVRCDGGDRVAASTASDWIFMGNGTDATQEVNVKSNSAAVGIFMSTTAADNTTAQSWIFSRLTAAVQARINGAALAVLSTSGSILTTTLFEGLTAVIDDNGGAGVDSYVYRNSIQAASAASTSAYATSASAPLNLCASGNGSFPLTGDIFSARIYQSALTETQRTINKKVDDWALGRETWLVVGDSLSAGSGGVTTWPAKLQTTAGETVLIVNVAVSNSTASQILAQWTANKDVAPTKVFVLGGINDIAVSTSAATAYASLATIYSEAAALGVEVIAMPTLPFGNAASWTAPKQVQLELLEASILADGNVDVIINFYDLMGQPGTPEDLAAIYDNGDGIHPNAAGTTFMADEVATALGL